MQVHDTPLVINAKGATVAVTVGAGGADVYYGASAATASRVNGGTLAAAGSTFQVTAPTWVVRSDQSQAPAADISFVEQAPSTSAGSAGSSGGATPTATKIAPYAAAGSELVRVDASTSSRIVFDAATTNASPILTSATAAFTDTDIGQPIAGLGLPDTTTILSRQSATQVTLNKNATQTATAMTMAIGSGQIPVTLPASAPAGTVVEVKKLDATSKQAVIVPSAGDSIDGLTQAVIGQRYRARRFVKDSGTTWVADGGLSPDPPMKGNIVDWIGDSISPQSSNIANGNSSMNGSGKFDDYLWWAHLLSNGKLLYGKPAGIGSTRADHMLARIHDQALREPGHFCGIQTGTNDSSYGFTPAQYAAYIRAMVAIIQGTGRAPILTTPNPVPATFRPLQDQYRRFIISYAAANGFPLVDFYSLLVDPLNGGYLAAYDSGDGIHPNTAGKKAMGQLIADTLTPYLSPFTPPVQMVNTTTDSSTLLANGLFLTDTNADGVPDGWTKAGTQTYSLVTGDAAIKGNALRIVDSASSGFSQVTSNNLTGTTTGRGGHRIAFTGLVKVTGTGAVGPNLLCALNAPSGTINLKALTTFLGVATPGWQRFYCEGTAPSDCNGISVTLSSNGGTNVDAQVAQLGVYDLTADGI